VRSKSEGLGCPEIPSRKPRAVRETEALSTPSGSLRPIHASTPKKRATLTSQRALWIAGASARRHQNNILAGLTN